ncbi:DUF1116 domain-containing protein [Orrella sp. JC864]|uniref:oxamate carbamoyltransferase subunit AllG family protein n=1 Tax=Orrella sp. JC864 TaxID=3120298 RepID=UPI0012BC16F2
MGPKDPAAGDPAKAAALAALAAVRPHWGAVQPARSAVGLPGRTLLHAGPPYADAARPAAPVLSSAALACVHEGWADSIEAALALIAAREVTLAPAQSYGVVLPLAAVAGPGTALVGVADGAGAAPRAWSLLGSGAGPQIRFGTRDPAILPRLRWRDQELAPRLHEIVSAAPVDLIALARQGLAGGDDLHASTAAAQAALAALLARALRPAAQPADARIGQMLEGSPLFFLTLWMAACHLMLDAAARQAHGSACALVVALAGNGRDLGVRLAGQPRRWFVSPAPPPAGPRLDPAGMAPAAALVGDSGVIDAAGFGAQALALAPAVQQALAPWLPPDWRERPQRLLQGPHPLFADLGLRVGADAAAGLAPLAAIAMVAADGAGGLLGRGIAMLDDEVFRRAARGLAEGA